MVEPIRRTRLSQRIVAQICQLIRQGLFGPGDRLPPERELSEQLKVSRASLREALRALEISGIVEARHGGGTYVRHFSELDMISPLALVLEASDDIFGDLWETRIIFEPSIAALAAMRASNADLDDMAAIVEMQRCLTNSPDEDERAMTLDQSFHAAIAHASSNAVAQRVQHLLHQLLQAGLVHFNNSPERRERTYRGHHDILCAIRDRNPQRARAAMLRHLQEVEAFILNEVIGESNAQRVRD